MVLAGAVVSLQGWWQRAPRCDTQHRPAARFRTRKLLDAVAHVDAVAHAAQLPFTLCKVTDPGSTSSCASIGSVLGLETGGEPQNPSRADPASVTHKTG